MADQSGTAHGYSADGHWYWNGTEWLAVAPQGSSGTPDGQPPQMAQALPQSSPKRLTGPVKVVLIVVACLLAALLLVIGAAIAIPVFLNQDSKSAEAAVQTDLRNAATAEETVLTEQGRYTSNVNELQQAGFTYSAGKNYEGGNALIRVQAVGSQSYCLTGVAENGTSFAYDSMSGLRSGGCP